MTATNHVLTGALIGAVIVTPVVALPLAFVSHFVLDALPHFTDKTLALNSRKFMVILGLDMLLALTVLVVIMVLQPAHWRLLLACGVFASAPDLMWLPLYIRGLYSIKAHPFNRIQRFHDGIQWSVSPQGIRIELAWFTGVLAILLGRYT